MIKYIIAGLLFFTLFALAVIWVLSGGPRRVLEDTQAMIDRSTPKEGEVVFSLPWQPAQIFPTLDLSEALQIGDDESARTPQERLQTLEAEYDRLQTEVSQSRTFQNPSPYRGMIVFSEGGSAVNESDPALEYLHIAAAHTNTQPIDITGWTLESALSGVRVALPPAATPYIANTANAVSPTLLAPGALALVSSAPSPVGVSFRENRCSGYLSQFQSFSPPLANECPTPTDVLPLTEENLIRFGDECFDAIQYLPQCRFPTDSANLTWACGTYLAEHLSYNGCVQSQSFRSGFHTNVWRLFLGSPTDLWRNSHDAIRLLDREGRTVSVFVY